MARVLASRLRPGVGASQSPQTVLRPSTDDPVFLAHRRGVPHRRWRAPYEAADRQPVWDALGANW